MTQELLKCGYESPFMEELKAAAITPDFLKVNARRRASIVVHPPITNGMKQVDEVPNHGVNHHDDILSNISVEVENNWNLRSRSLKSNNSLIHRGRTSSVTSNGHVNNDRPVSIDQL